MLTSVGALNISHMFVHARDSHTGVHAVLIVGGQEVQQHRQVMAEDHDPSPRGAQRGPVLCGG